MSLKNVHYMIAILTADIVKQPIDIDDRIKAIKELCAKLDETAWLQDLEDHAEHIENNKSWLRDWWNSCLYVEKKCTEKRVGLELYNKYNNILHYFKNEDNEMG